MSMKWKHKGREFESIGYQLKDKKTMIIYGAGDYAEDILNVYEGSECKDSWKLWLVDRDEKKQQEGKRGYRVMSPGERELLCSNLCNTIRSCRDKKRFTGT